MNTEPKPQYGAPLDRRTIAAIAKEYGEKLTKAAEETHDRDLRDSLRKYAHRIDELERFAECGWLSDAGLAAAHGIISGYEEDDELSQFLTLTGDDAPID